MFLLNNQNYKIPMTQYYHQSIMWLLSISEDSGYEDWQYYYYPVWAPGLGCPVEWYLGSIITTLQYLSLPCLGNSNIWKIRSTFIVFVQREKFNLNRILPFNVLICYWRNWSLWIVESWNLEILSKTYYYQKDEVLTKITKRKAKSDKEFEKLSRAQDGWKRLVNNHRCWVVQ